MGLGLGLLGSSLALPFGLYVLICQRTAGESQGRCRMVLGGRALGVCCRHSGPAFACRSPTCCGMRHHLAACLCPRPPSSAPPLPSPVPLPYCLCSRSAEQYIQDEVSGVSERRRAVAAALIIFALLVLFPMAPDVVSDMGSMSSPGNFI